MIGPDVIGHGLDVVGRLIAPEMIPLDDEQINAPPLGDFPDAHGLGHVNGIDRRVHAEPVEYHLGFIDKLL